MIRLSRDSRPRAWLSGHHEPVDTNDRYSAFGVSASIPVSYPPVDRIEVKFLDGRNRSCRFCMNDDHIGKAINPIDTDLFNESLHAWLDDQQELEKPVAVYGTGGEPLMAQDLVEEVVVPLAAGG